MNIDFSQAVTAEDKEHAERERKIDRVKAEARKRILAVLPEHKQRNLIGHSSILAEKGRKNWTRAEVASWEAGKLAWEKIDAIRARSNEIERMSRIPDDLGDDKHWP